VPGDNAGVASGIYKMASSLGAALGVAVSAALFTALSGLKSQSGPLADLFLGRTDNIAIRVATAMPLLFNVLTVVGAMVAIALTVPRDDRSVGP
jgi:MFS transporter, DHA2 family, multidrug resistance protein